MIRTLRPILAVVSVLAAFVLAAGSASALTIDPVGNSGATNADPVAVTFTHPGALTGFNCILDSAPVSCAGSPIQLGGLSEGTHSLLVNAIELVQGPCVAWMPPDNVVCVGWSMIPMPVGSSTTFTVDRTAPAVAITNGPAEGSSSAQTSASFGISASDGTVDCKLDGATVACGASVDLSGLSVGTHQLVVTSVDQAGNVGSATRNFTVAAASVPSVAPKLLSVPKSAKVGAKIKLKVSCPDGCTISVVFKRSSGKSIKASIRVPAGTGTAMFTPKRSLTKTLSKALAAGKKVTATFTLGGVSKSSRIKK